VQQIIKLEGGRDQIARLQERTKVIARKIGGGGGDSKVWKNVCEISRPKFTEAVVQYKKKDGGRGAASIEKQEKVLAPSDDCPRANGEIWERRSARDRGH